MLASRSNKQYSSSLLISFLFLIIIISTLTYILQTWPSSLFTSSSSSSQSSLSSSPPKSLNPSTPYTTTTLFTEHDTYKNLSHVYDSLWDDLLPANGGFLQRISEDVDGEGKVIRKKYKYGITMFHSLHCLGIMRGGVQELFREMEELKMGMDGMREGEGGMKEREEKRGGAGHHFGHAEHGDPLHWLHCFDYLRQTILCNADGTLEPPKVNSKGKGNVDGMMERQCRDPEELWRLSVESFEGRD